ncbi:MAG: hypothetical protein BYD32DRAFT_43657 [Podila humilis]|nr:MAG: hypothetical protein BYD32DRAFT_43657 [Podila humilis]
MLCSAHAMCVVICIWTILLFPCFVLFCPPPLSHPFFVGFFSVDQRLCALFALLSWPLRCFLLLLLDPRRDSNEMKSFICHQCNGAMFERRTKRKSSRRQEQEQKRE